MGSSLELTHPRSITNHLATVFRVPGQKFFGWLLSGMAITNDLPGVNQ